MSLRVVITGGTRGIGQGMAQSFLDGGHRVCITGRSEASVSRGMQGLTGSADAMMGVPCEVTELDHVQKVWDETVARWGGVDLWVNNAGIAHENKAFESLQPDEYQQVIKTNLIGVLHGSRVAIRGMNAQGFGQLYNMEGFGSDGRTGAKLSVYGLTKRGLTYFTEDLIKEQKGRPANVGYLSPGIVLTAMTLKEVKPGDPQWERAAGFYLAVAERVETVAPWLVDRMVADVGKHGSAIRYLTFFRILWGFIQTFVLRRDRGLLPSGSFEAEAAKVLGESGGESKS